MRRDLLANETAGLVDLSDLEVCGK